MFVNKNYFTSLSPWNPHIPIQHVILVDGVSKAKIEGFGIVRFLINNRHAVEFKNALYVPSLSTNLFSIKDFIRYQGCMFLAEHNVISLAFPKFIATANIGSEVTISTSPTKCKPTFSTLNAITHKNCNQQSSSQFLAKRNINKLSPGDLEEFIDDNILHPSTNDISKSSPQKSSSPPSHMSPPTLIPESTPNISTTTDSSSSNAQSDSKHLTNNKSNPATPTPTDTLENTSTSPPINTKQSDQTSSTIATQLPNWVHHDAKVTLKLPKINDFRKGILLKLHLTTSFTTVALENPAPKLLFLSQHFSTCTTMGAFFEDIPISYNL